MSTPSSVDSSLWDADNYDMLMKTMTHPPSPPHTSDSECEAMSPASDTPSSPPVEDKEKNDEKKPTKKRKSWGQELPTPTTNLPPRKRAKTDAEKEQRRIERVLRNRAAAHSSRERKRAEQEALEKRKKEIEAENENMKNRLSQFEQEFADLQKKYRQLEHNYLLAKSHLPSDSGFNPVSIPEDRSISSGSISIPAVSAEQHGSDSDLVTSPTLVSDWADWTLFDENLTISPDFLDIAGTLEETMSNVTTLCDSDVLPESSGLDSYHSIGYELFGEDSTKKPTIDLDLFASLAGEVSEL
ncbi:hypothetical protein AOL_s00079g350 [Orbilia oligospora ATCC 24927]|uniref:BZIP domain-containing protein n=1 Tax=Arthrobotrys oligospora (strain ATCC 24927 / CBS 115.81 / DSM 1491) TaxID=756982 RepID=G1XDG5_ARTOA|nr:hypothetical protein AOL_s00079g350 [Orbilia oligospora ATCC 24927]EGX48711.1 hypothetical protein AOL_s00079g350 [Orbilia oligospora ATCC 24927]